MTLTGGVGTPIFPIATPGEPQGRGDARGLNASGQVTGAEFGLVSADDTHKPYRFTPGAGVVKLTGCCDSQFGNDINDAGVVVGVAEAGAELAPRGFVAAGTSTTQLSILPGGYAGSNAGAIAINNAGQIVGISPASGGGSHAVLWSASGIPQDLGTLGGSFSSAIDINGPGQVIGWSHLAGGATTHFFLWSAGGGMVDLNAMIDPNITSVVEINDAGQIIGTYTAAGGQSHAFRYTPGTGLLDLGTLGGATSAPTGLNGRGDVVGSSTLADGSTHAFLWTAAEGMEDITALTGVPEVRRLNDNMQTLTGTMEPSVESLSARRVMPRLVQLQVTQFNAPPTALFTVECNALTCVLDARGSLDDKPGLIYSWDLNKFPEGSATGAVVTVTYPHSGQRTPTLTVTDANGLTSSVSKTFAVLDSPIADFAYSCTGLTCSFDARSSISTGAPISEYIWSFGDGSSLRTTNAMPSHPYAGAGTYAVTLEVWVTSTERAVLTKQVTVGAPQNEAPVANFSFSCNNLTCTLDGTSSTDDQGIVSYAWDLNKYPDGSATGSAVTVTYPHGGVRYVTLTVTDANGLSNSILKSFDPGTDVSSDAPPVARFTTSCTGTICTLDASTSTDDVGIVSYAWVLGKFPDNTASGVTVTTDYFHTSTRTITLTVTDTKGQTNSVTQTIEIP